MNKCPECEGKKGYNELLTPEWHEPPEYKWNDCRTCTGEGKISDLSLAVYRARGGPTPIQFVGFA
jgi:hypothetical protein